jgi:hypothetical protein
MPIGNRGPRVLRRRGSLVLITVALGLFLGPPNSIGQQQPAEPQPLPTLTNTHEAHSLTLEQAVRNYPVHLRTVVTYYDTYVDQRRPAFFVSDSSGAIFVALSYPPAVPFEAGDLVEITGVSAAGDYAPIVSAARAQLIGKSLLPATAPRVSLTGPAERRGRRPMGGGRGRCACGLADWENHQFRAGFERRRHNRRHP